MLCCNTAEHDEDKVAQAAKILAFPISSWLCKFSYILCSSAYLKTQTYPLHLTVTDTVKKMEMQKDGKIICKREIKYNIFAFILW